MVIARAFSFTFWQEFWFEYAVGFAFGWFIFQLKSMRMMTDSLGRALAMAFRAEFFSMLTVMGGMGAVMTFVTPSVVGAQPKATTYAFWGFGMLGLLAGYVFTFPMNWLMVRLGWKHGMGSPKDSHPVESRAARAGVLVTMGVLGAVALVIPAVLTEVRKATPITVAGAELPEPRSLSRAPRGGLREALEAAEQNLREGRRREGVTALDAAYRAAQVLSSAAPGQAGSVLISEVTAARRAIQMGNERGALAKVQSATGAAGTLATITPTRAPRTDRYRGATLMNAEGAVVGKVTRVDGENVQVAVGGAKDVFGFLDLGSSKTVSVPRDHLLLGPRRTVGYSYAMIRTTGVLR
jgi:hypothetical protein